MARTLKTEDLLISSTHVTELVLKMCRLWDPKAGSPEFRTVLPGSVVQQADQNVPYEFEEYLQWSVNKGLNPKIEDARKGSHGLYTEREFAQAREFLHRVAPTGQSVEVGGF